MLTLDNYPPTICESGDSEEEWLLIWAEQDWGTSAPVVVLVQCPGMWASVSCPKGRRPGKEIVTQLGCMVQFSDCLEENVGVVDVY